MFDEPTNNQSQSTNNMPSGPKPIEPLAEDQGGPQPVPPAPSVETAEPQVMPKIEDLPKTTPPVNLPNLENTEDIFNETDTVPPPPAAPPSTPPPAGPSEPLTELPDDMEEDGGGSRKLFWVGLIVILIIIAGGGYYAYSKFFSESTPNIPFLNLNKEAPPVNQDQINQNTNNKEVNKNINTNVNSNENVNTNANTNVNKKSTVDSDKDGLTDDEEEQYGTDPFEPDSDGDGLYDREEVKVYHTNPLNPDTDGDGYLDGEEVENGYNPLGPGKLLELNFEE